MSPCRSEILETGIKVIDLLYPFTKGGRVGLVGEVGKRVLIAELIYRMTSQYKGTSVYVAIGKNGDVLNAQMKEDGVSDGVSLVFSTGAGIALAKDLQSNGREVLLIVDPGSQLIGENSLTSLLINSSIEFDGTIILSQSLAQLGIYPAIDPLGIVQPSSMKKEHYEVAQAAQVLLQRYKDLQGSIAVSGLDSLSEEDKISVYRARKLQRFFSQPFFVAAAFTNVPGKYISLAETIRGCRGIIEGAYDDLPEDAFYLIGSIDEAIQKEKKSS